MAVKEAEAAAAGDKGPAGRPFAAPRRIFLGSTTARTLARTDAPVIVVPRDHA